MRRKVALSVLLATTLSFLQPAQAEETTVVYEGFCYGGKVAARKAGSLGPTRILMLLVRGEIPVECLPDDEIQVTAAGPVTEAFGEGMILPAAVTIKNKQEKKYRIIFSTFQERPYPRTRPAQNI